MNFAEVVEILESWENEIVYLFDVLENKLDGKVDDSEVEFVVETGWLDIVVVVQTKLVVEGADKTEILVVGWSHWAENVM